MGCASSSEQDAMEQPAPGPVRHVSGRPTRTITGPPAWKANRPLSDEELDRMRREFWDTRVEGSPQTWAALRVVADTILAGDFEQANALLEASNITTPNGTMEVCYDGLGREYSVPPFCLAPPANQRELLHGKQRPRSTKQAKITPSKEIVVFKCRLVEFPDIELKQELGTPISQVKQKFVEEAGEKAPSADRLRFFFMGRECKDDDLLQTCGISNGVVITVFARE